jgi:cytochrome c1
VKSQILKPYQSMPAFTDFSEEEMADLLAYLETL